MNAKYSLLVVIAPVSVLLAGCINLTPQAPASATHGLILEAKSSPKILVAGPRFQLNHGSLELAGTVSKQAGATSTAFSHLDILFYDHSGNVLQNRSIRFTPQSLGHSRFGSKRGFYALNLDELPAGTTRLEVRAHDADLTAPHGPSQP